MLLERGYSVIGVDIRSNPWNEEIDDLTIIADLCRPEDVDLLPGDIDMVIHLAAHARVYNLVINPELARDNFLMLFNMLEFCRNHLIPGFLFSSSREVYGSSKNGVDGEADADICRSESPYAATKIGSEALIHAYHRCYGINYIIVRFSNVYGMYDTSDRVIPLFIRRTQENQDLVVYGRDKRLDFTYIDDTVAGLIGCIEQFQGVKNSTFNIASGRSVSLVDVASLIRDAMGGSNAVVIKENRKGELVRSAINISKAKKELGYVPRVPIEDGIRRSISWYREYFSE